MLSANVLASAVNCTSSPTAGILFYRINYWFCRTRVFHRAKKWVVMDTERWRAETGLTEKQRKTALRNLTRSGLVETMRSPKYGDNRTWIRVSDEAESLLKGNGSGSPSESPQEAQEVPPRKAQEGPSRILEIDRLEVSLELDCGTPRDPASPMTEESSKISKPEAPMVESKKTTVAEVIKAAKSGRLKKAPNTKSLSEQLKFLWLEKVAEATGEYVPPLTKKSIGQLGMFAKKCPPGEAPEILAHAVENWIAFVKKAESDAGAFNTPAQPTISFLLLHAGPAVSLFHSYRDAAQGGQSLGEKTTLKLQSTATSPASETPGGKNPPTKEQATEDKPATLEELKSLIWDEDDS